MVMVRQQHIVIWRSKPFAICINVTSGSRFKAVRKLKKVSSTITPHRDYPHTPTPISRKFRLSAVRETPSCSDT